MKYETIAENKIRLTFHKDHHHQIQEDIGIFLSEEEIRELIKVLTNALFDMKNFK